MSIKMTESRKFWSGAGALATLEGAATCMLLGLVALAGASHAQSRVECRPLDAPDIPTPVQLVTVLNTNPVDTLKVKVCLDPDATGKCSTTWLYCVDPTSGATLQWAFVDHASNVTIFVPDGTTYTAQQYIQWSVAMGPSAKDQRVVGPLHTNYYTPLSGRPSKFMDIAFGADPVYCCGAPMVCQSVPVSYWKCPVYSTCDTSDACSTDTPCTCLATPTPSPTLSPTPSPTTPMPTPSPSPSPTTPSPTPLPTPSPTTLMPTPAPTPPPSTESPSTPPPPASQGGNGGGNAPGLSPQAQTALAVVGGLVLMGLCAAAVAGVLCWGSAKRRFSARYGDPSHWPLNPRAGGGGGGQGRELEGHLLPGEGYRSSAQVEADGAALGDEVSEEMAGNTIDFRMLTFSEQIGHGSSGVVFRGKLKGEQKAVAVKQLFVPPWQDEAERLVTLFKVRPSQAASRAPPSTCARALSRFSLLAPRLSHSLCLSLSLPAFLALSLARSLALPTPPTPLLARGQLAQHAGA